MSAFTLRPGIYHVHGIGKVNALNNELSDEKLFELYQVKRAKFPYISVNENTKEYLSAKKLKADDVAKLVQNATSVEEVEMLHELSDTKTVDRIVETKLSSLTQNQ